MTTIAPRAAAPFRNEPIRDFSAPADRASLEAAIARARERLGRRYPLVIYGERLHGGRTIPSVNPARPSEIVGDVDEAMPEQASRALDAAAERFGTWKFTPAAERAEFLFRAAERIRATRDDWNALLVLEVGKPWIEADADTAEAIDFLEFYAREALRLAEPPPLTPIAGERNRLVYLPLGVGVVIPPWNFAFAIMAGMSAAAIVTGNTAILKPSPDAAVIAAHFVDLMHDLGLPPGVLNFVPGDGPTVGEQLVTDPRTRFIAFTGSKGVGLRINELAAKTAPGQRWIKRVIAEMGGKDAIVVADDADLDAAVAGVVVSAYGFAGQKCSACSRAIVDARVYDAFLAKLVPAVESLRVGDPASNPDVGPVINQKAVDKILGYVEIGRGEGRLLTGGTRISGDGFYIAPTAIADVDPRARIAQEEIFGPVLAVIKAADYDDALRIANDTEFGLTGAVFSRSEERLRRAEAEFFVGNLYLNRKCTGALVGGQPFGGFNMSGTDSKAGGYDYLLLFSQGKSISRKIAAHAADDLAAGMD
ncbi:1-pyrroline-5-carboxylate dehydrogenase 2 [Vulcanimicrobium alpinum]|uniref:L-glutamate gamma-semialdehyde dehydrogenase n=1 Tax=Vulcanimicrobium alpinum TaxID=3016050 RepID=A0AAN1XXD9_UNVUL|nr:1-pyrroline-5-carboxylate dehydrogenase 2 [Vulcanimicrobium alpinum]